MTDLHKGLTQAEMIRSREQHGRNLLTPAKRKSLWALFFEKFSDPVIRILLVAAFLSLGIGFIHNEFAETIGIFCAIFLATGVAFWFEYDAMRKFDLLNSTNDDTPVKVVRDGEVMEIPKQDVVVGDVVILQSGEEVPADGRNSAGSRVAEDQRIDADRRADDRQDDRSGPFPPRCDLSVERGAAGDDGDRRSRGDGRREGGGCYRVRQGGRTVDGRE